MTRSFGLDAPSALKAFRSTVERLKDDDLNVDLARDCAGKAWHLCDHVYKALGSSSEFTRLGEFQKHVRGACPELSYLQDICVESKHAVIKLYAPSIDAACFHRGDFSRDFSSEDFDTSRLEVVLRQGQRVLFNEVVDRAVEFWSGFLDARGIG